MHPYTQKAILSLLEPITIVSYSDSWVWLFSQNRQLGPVNLLRGGICSVHWGNDLLLQTILTVGKWTEENAVRNLTFLGQEIDLVLEGNTLAPSLCSLREQHQTCLSFTIWNDAQEKSRHQKSVQVFRGVYSTLGAELCLIIRVLYANHDKKNCIFSLEFIPCTTPLAHLQWYPEQRGENKYTESLVKTVSVVSTSISEVVL